MGLEVKPSQVQWFCYADCKHCLQFYSNFLNLLHRSLVLKKTTSTAEFATWTESYLRNYGYFGRLFNKIMLTGIESGMCYDETRRCRDVTRHERCTKNSMYQYANACKRSCGLCGMITLTLYTVAIGLLVLLLSTFISDVNPEWLMTLIHWRKDTKTDVTPAILSRDFVAQLYRATKLQCATCTVACCNFVAQ